MKKLTLLLIGILFTLTVAGQSHVFKHNKENKYINGAWGRWVTCTSDIEIKMGSGGYYTISFYVKEASHPELILNVKFVTGIEGEFTYNGIINEIEFEIKSTKKLSEMSKGYPGMIVLSLGGEIIGFILG